MRFSTVRIRRIAAAGIGLAVAAGLAPGAGAPGALAETGKPPRFASLRSDTVHVRVGPGQEFPIKWTYKRPGLPVQILIEAENWRYVKDADGDEGWVHHGGLSGRRMAVITGATRTLRRAPAEGAEPVARLEPGVIARLEKCDRAWCRVAAGGHRGWLKHGEFWGIVPGERID